MAWTLKGFDNARGQGQHARKVVVCGVDMEVFMVEEINAGDVVKLLSVPDWLDHDLPRADQVEIPACIGKTTTLDEIDKFGYFWVSFTGRPLNEDGTLLILPIGEQHCSGHSFCVTRECLEKIK